MTVKAHAARPTQHLSVITHEIPASSDKAPGAKAYKRWWIKSRSRRPVNYAERAFYLRDQLDEPEILSPEQHKARLAIRAWQARAAAPPSGSSPAGRGFFERLREWWQVVGP